jgi:predicted transcriptional regulator
MTITMDEKMIERIERYLYETKTKRTTLCKRLGISTTYLYKLLNHERTFSDNISRKINDYLQQYKY